MAKSRALMFLIFGGLCSSFVHGHDTGGSCSARGLLQCESHKTCYEPKQKCNGFWDCADHSDEFNCTNTRMSFNGVSKGQNLAWLVTPILLLLGAAYGIYKCARDGVCGAIRRRIMQGRRAREPQASDYHPLHQVSFYTSTQIPCTQLGINLANLTPQQQMMLVHNQSFSIQIQGSENPMSQHSGLITASAVPGSTGGAVGGVFSATTLPSYEEAITTKSDDQGGTIVVTKNGDIVSIVPGGVHPPPYPGASTSRGRSKRIAVPVPANHMEAIEEVEEVDEEEEDEEDNDTETFSLLKECRGDGSRGRRRHHSQWSQKRRSSDRRRHHSCPS